MNYYNSVTGFNFGIFFILILIGYVLAVYPTYKMYQMANLKNPWVAFVPFIGQLKMFNLADLSMWWYVGVLLIALIPLLGALIVFIFAIWYTFKIYKNFGLGTFGCILAIFFTSFVSWYVVLTKKPFIGIINPKFTNN